MKFRPNQQVRYLYHNQTVMILTAMPHPTAKAIYNIAMKNGKLVQRVPEHMIRSLEDPNEIIKDIL